MDDAKRWFVTLSLVDPETGGATNFYAEPIHASTPFFGGSPASVGNASQLVGALSNLYWTVLLLDAFARLARHLYRARPA